MNNLIKIDRTDIRKCMKLLRSNEALYLHGNRISHIAKDSFRIEFTYGGINEICERSAAWVRNYLKKDYLNESVYSTNYREEE